MLIGFLYIHDAWVPQPATQSTSIGKCSRRLGVLAREAGVNENTHAAMTDGTTPDFVPRRNELPCPQIVEVDEWEE